MCFGLSYAVFCLGTDNYSDGQTRKIHLLSGNLDSELHATDKVLFIPYQGMRNHIGLSVCV